MSDIQLKVISRDTITYLLKELDSFEKNKTIIKGLKAGGNVFKRAGKRRLKAYMRNTEGVTGNLLKSIHVKAKRKSPGVLIGFKRPMGSHAHLIDRGTAIRKTKKGFNRGILPSYKTRFRLGFWSDTKNKEYSKAMDKVQAGVEAAIERINMRQ